MPNILCVDSDPVSTSVLSDFLSKKGYNVVTASSGNDALNKIKKGAFDLVISDFRLPDKGGIEFIRSIKSLGQKLPIIIVTSYADVRSVVRSIKQGAFDYVAKPIVTDELLDSVERAIKRSKDETQKNNAGSRTRFS